MPSEECFVYITLPDQTEPVTAGKYQLDTDRQGRAVGQFVYGKSYLSRNDRVAFDPVELKLQVPSYRTTKLRGNFGALRDSSPDAWGRKLIEKRLGNLAPTEIEYLLNSPDDRAGALGFGFGGSTTRAGAPLQPHPRPWPPYRDRRSDRCGGEGSGSAETCRSGCRAGRIAAAGRNVNGRCPA